jgi:phage FluMu protein Com
MPMLRVRCAKCNALIATGTEMSYETFRHSTFQTRTIECPNCEHVQTWTQDDVDRTVFQEKGSGPS